MSEQKFVAREAQLSQLHAFLDAALESQGQVAFVVGEAGSGKTALVTEFARRAEAENRELVVATGTCNAQTGIGDPYLPFREILAQLTGDVDAKLAQGAISAGNARRLQELARWSYNALVELGPDLINVLVPGTALMAKASKYVLGQVGVLDNLKQIVERKAERSALDQSHIFEQYTNVLKELARKRALVMVLDDLQWADTASTGLLFHLGRRIGESRILVLGAYRPEEVKLGREGERHPLEKVLAEFKRYFGDVNVDLDRAEEEEARDFVNALLDLEPNRLGEGFRQALLEHTGGHPLFAVELLRDLREEGDLEKDAGGRWIIGERLDWDTLPPRVEGVIEERIGRLEVELRETLTVGSVEGEEFTAEVVARVRTVDERNLVHRLSDELDRQHHLVVSQGMRRLGQQRLSSYRFRHNLFQRYLYEELDEAQRAYLHEDVGNALEALYGEEVEEIAVQLAWHFQEAAIIEKAITYIHQAGEQARYRYANTEAIGYFRRALALISETPTYPSREEAEADLQEKLGDVLFLTGQPEQAKDEYEDALESVSQRDLIWRARLQRKIGKTWERERYYHKEALQAYDLAEITLGQQPIEYSTDWWREWIAIQVDRIWTSYWNKDHWRDMLVLVEKTRLPVQQYGTPIQRSRFYECLVLVENRRYQYVVPEETVSFARMSLAAGKESGDLGQVARSQYLLGFCHLGRTELDEAREAVQDALTLAERIGDVDVQLMCLTYLPVIYRKLGEVEETRNLLDRSLSEAKKRESVEYEGVALANLAWVALRDGNLDQAQVDGQAALDLWHPPVKMPFMSLAVWPLIGVRLAQNQIAAAIDLVCALKVPEQQPLPDSLAEVVESVLLAWEAGETELARINLNRAAELAQELGYL